MVPDFCVFKIWSIKKKIMVKGIKEKQTEIAHFLFVVPEKSVSTTLLVATRAILVFWGSVTRKTNFTILQLWEQQ